MLAGRRQTLKQSSMEILSLTSSHLEIYVSLFQPATVVSKKFHQTAKLFQRNFIKLPSCFKEILSNWQFDEISLKQLLRVGTRMHISQKTLKPVLSNQMNFAIVTCPPTTGP